MRYISKQLKKHVLFLVFACTVCPLYAQKHYLITWGEAGAQALMYDIELVKNTSSIGGGGGIGFGYELHQKQFIFTAGIGANITYNALQLQPFSQRIEEARDSENDIFDFVYEQKSRTDGYTNLSIQIPILFGAQFSRFFFLVGPKVDLSVLRAYNINANLSSYGEYEMFIDPFTGMPQHMYYTDINLIHKGNTSFNFNIAASAEIGWQLGEIYKSTGYDVPKPKNTYRISLFADYGLLDWHTKGTNECISLPTSVGADMTSSISMNDILSTRYRQTSVHNLMIGVKFTALFQLPEKKGCVLCNTELPFNRQYK